MLHLFEGDAISLTARELWFRVRIQHFLSGLDPSETGCGPTGSGSRFEFGSKKYGPAALYYPLNFLLFVIANNNKQPIKLPYLGRLDILTIEGIPSDLHNLKELLIAAPNLSVLVIDLDCLLTLLEDENESLIVYILLHRHILDLCIRIQENTEQAKKSKLTIEQIHLIARIFTRVRNLTIDFETSEEYIQSNIIKSIINEFKQLVIFHIYGKIPHDMIENDIRQWIIEQNPFRIKSTDIFRVECTSGWFKLWL